ncbi:MAG TPA: Ger(x)C family spore germination protein, partial [Clostridiales bacterium]|nr:Ger(x)C family spore germination protein [Clostridiales bacterium]
DVKEHVNQLINKCKSLGIDVFKFGNVVTRQFLTIDALEEYNWNEHFKDVRFTTNVEFLIKRTGTQRKSYPIANPEE